MNEIASDDELDSEPVEAANTAEALLRANISQKVAIISGRSTSDQPSQHTCCIGGSDNSADGGEGGEAARAS